MVFCLLLLSSTSLLISTMRLSKQLYEFCMSFSVNLPSRSFLDTVPSNAFWQLTRKLLLHFYSFSNLLLVLIILKSMQRSLSFNAVFSCKSSLFSSLAFLIFLSESARKEGSHSHLTAAALQVGAWQSGQRKEAYSYP